MSFMDRFFNAGIKDPQQAELLRAQINSGAVQMGTPNVAAVGGVPGSTPSTPALSFPPVDPRSHGGNIPIFNPPVTNQSPGVTTGNSGMNGTTPTASSPANPSVPPSSALDQIMSKDKDAIDAARAKMEGLPTSAPKTSLWSDPDHGHLRTFLNILGGGIEGGITGSIHEGVRVQEPMLNQPQQAADKKFNEERTSAQHSYDEAIKNYDVDLAGQRESRAQKSEESQEKARLDLAKERQDNLQREKDRDVKTDQWHQEEVKRQGDRDAATEKHWQEEIKERRNEFHQRIQEAKDAKEGVQVMRTYVTEENSRLNEIDRRISSIDGNIMSKNDPQAQQERKSLLDERQVHQQEIQDLRGMMRKHLGLDHDPAAAAQIPQFQGTQNFTVSAPGKPAVQKALTFDQVQKLQQAGIQLSPQAAAKK